MPTFTSCLLSYGVFVGVLLARAPDAQFVLSEGMADPAALSDIHGEFLEWTNPGQDSLICDSLTLDIDGKLFPLASLTIKPGGIWILCRDSLRENNGGMLCNRQLSSLALANARTLTVSAIYNGIKSEAILPASRPGISWENTMEKELDFQRFLPAMSPWHLGDSATPGLRNSRSVARPLIDMGITNVTLSSSRSLSVQIQNLGEKQPDWVSISLWLDEDFDGDFESFLDSSKIPGPFIGHVHQSFLLDLNRPGLVQARLGLDENPGNNFYQIQMETGNPLLISEWCPDPESGAPEWVEIRNATLDSGGHGRVLSLNKASLNFIPLGDRAGDLLPGEFIVLTESMDRFRAYYGALKVRLLQLSPWPVLRNTGDTLRLESMGILFDSVAYGSSELKGDGGCLSLGQGGVYASKGSPGFLVQAMEEFSWVVSGRVAGQGRAMDVEVKAPIGLKYGLKIFDLEGNVVRDLGGGEAGQKNYSWSGEGIHGGLVRPGPYILCLSILGRPPQKQVVAVIGPR